MNDISAKRTYQERSLCSKRNALQVGQTYTYDERGDIHHIRPRRPLRRYEFWKDSIQLQEEVGKDIERRYLRELMADKPEMFRSQGFSA